MAIKFTFSGRKLVPRALTEALLRYPRRWEAGVVLLGLMFGAAALYWWLWRPGPTDTSLEKLSAVQLDVAALKELAAWADERERAVVAPEAVDRFNDLFQ